MLDLPREKGIALGLVAALGLWGCAHAPSPQLRARRFSEYITAMHRRIHARFTLGFLADINARQDPRFADQSLWAALEIVVDDDGTLDRVNVVRSSRVEELDLAAIASVRSAAPFAAPPRGDQERRRQGAFHLAIPS